MNMPQVPEVFYYPLILLLNSSPERTAYIVLQTIYTQKTKKSYRACLSYSLILKLLCLDTKVIWQT